MALAVLPIDLSLRLTRWQAALAGDMRVCCYRSQSISETFVV
jgi:hypothetical protein